VHELIAMRIIDLAKKVERDIDKLRDAGLGPLGLQGDGGQQRFR
jgi:hypothetical protein